ncbi:MAG: Helix-turn-helix domain [Actinomycetota bacterium]|jgi:transcriptional regulator with XRE-family HTH domain
MTDRNPQPIVPSNWEFDGAGFARVIAAARIERGWSTRELARRACISQPYVVALERSRESTAERTPTPAVDVVARLADALGIDPADLLSAAVRRSSRHVVLVLDSDHRHPLSHAREFAGHDDSQWVWASSQSSGVPRAANHHIDLRRERSGDYRPADIARSLHRELHDLGQHIAGRRLGLVFPETGAVMATIADPTTVLEFERGWGEVVADAAVAAKSHAAWNVCVYDVHVLRGLDEPVAAFLELVRSHDTVWSAGRRHRKVGADAAFHVLERLRPSGADTADWSAHARQLVDSLDIAA